jgi:hypothetical protein
MPKFKPRHIERCIRALETIWAVVLVGDCLRKCPKSSVSDPDPVGSAFNLNLDPKSGSGFWIQMSKNRFKKPKFTMTYSSFNLKDKNRKMLKLSWNFNHSSLSLFQELITLGIFFLSLFKNYHIECKLIFVTFLTVHCLKISLTIIFYSSA